MALAPMSVDVVLGEFTEKEFGNYFHYSVNEKYNSGKTFGGRFPHLVWVGGLGQQYRYAEVKKTVAYVVVDEDEYGSPVIEKWLIKKNIAYS